MNLRRFGSSGLNVSPLGFGAGRMGGGNLSEDEAGRLLNAALDLGLNVVDTAPSYGMSEERIGRHIAHRRDEYVLISKCGYGAPNMGDWTPECIAWNIDASLRRMKTDRLDVMLFHSCPLDTVRRQELAEALHKAIAAGKLGIAGYSGENEALEFAVGCGWFGAVETSVNLFDQASLERSIPHASSRGIGVIAKRPVGNAPWRHAERPKIDDQAAMAYWDRMAAMRLDASSFEGVDGDWSELALRFACYAPGVSTAIAGTSSVANLKANVAAVEMGPLPADAFRAVRARFEQLGAKWPGMI